MYKLILSVNAAKELKRLKRQYQQAVIEALDDIKEDPTLGKPLTRELTGRFSYQVSVYRIIYKINIKEKTVQIISAGHRSSIYN